MNLLELFEEVARKVILYALIAFILIAIMAVACIGDYHCMKAPIWGELKSLLP